MEAIWIIHGMPERDECESRDYPSPSNSHWLPWLEREARLAGLQPYAPELPRPYEPDYEQWAGEAGRLPQEALAACVGHSGGAGFLLRYLGENKIACKRLILVAPWLDPDKTLRSEFFAGALEHELEAVERIEIIGGDDDTANVKDSIAAIQERHPRAVLHIVPGGGHLTYDSLGGAQFPLLARLALGEVIEPERS